MDDPADIIAVQNINDENKVVLNGKDKLITLDSSDNTVVLNGKENRITVESVDSKGVFDGKGNKIIFENKKNKVIIDGDNDSCIIDVKADITLKAGGQLIIDAERGISNKGVKVGWDN
jgi:hypothetical protein